MTGEENIMLCSTSIIEEVKATVFSLEGASSGGPDGLNGKFYQYFWEIIKEDVLSVVKAYFAGDSLTKSFTHTNVVLILKNNVVQTFADLRLISLCNFINKVISKVVQRR